MALGPDLLRLVMTAAKRLQADRPGEPLRALALGFPDLLASDVQLSAMVGAETVAALPILPQSPEILRWHGIGQVIPHVRDTAALFAGLGMAMEVIDIAELRGGERIVDLNHPLPDDMVEAYDLVIDTGTLEHCFNVGQALVNVARSLRRGGYLVHAAPMNIYNHGFWNFNPTVYFDFFEDNGFRIEFLQGMTGHVLTGMKAVQLPAFQRFDTAPPRTAIYLLARREEIRPTVYPVQRKYRPAPPAPSATPAPAPAPTPGPAS
jgi:SAM-dependent methyltransferase